MNSLPNEILMKISHCNDGATLRKSIQVSRRWKSIVSSMRRIKREPITFMDIYASNAEPDVTICIYNKLTDKHFKFLAPYDKLYEYLWSIAPERLALTSSTNKLRKSLLEMPKWWFEQIRTISIFEDGCDLDITTLLTRIPNYTELTVEPCYTVDSVSQLLRLMPSTGSFKLLTGRTVVLDDSALDILIEKSNLDSNGLELFWNSDVVGECSMEKFLEFLEKTKFASRALVKVNHLVGRRHVLESFLVNQCSLWMTTMFGYYCKLRNAELSLDIDKIEA